MTLRQASVRQAFISGVFTPGDVSPLVVPEVVNLPIIFLTVSNISKNGWHLYAQ